VQVTWDMNIDRSLFTCVNLVLIKPSSYVRNVDSDSPDKSNPQWIVQVTQALVLLRDVMSGVETNLRCI
jgi:hypothetical protein